MPRCVYLILLASILRYCSQADWANKGSSALNSFNVEVTTAYRLATPVRVR